MLTIRRSNERGHFNHGWLDTFHTFSFGEYRDPAHMGFRSLRVINEDVVAPGAGFGMHPHRDMEIITWVLEGALAHRDDLGHGEIIRPGEAQRMTAGTGITHSEHNASDREPVHLLQIWIRPERAGLTPGYEQKAFPEADRRGRLRLIASRGGEDGSVHINQDARVYASIVPARSSVANPLAPGRHAWVQVARGELSLNGSMLSAGDGAAVSDEPLVTLTATAEAELLLFDLA